MSRRWLPQESIRRKRHGGRLSREELVAITRGLADGSLSDAQAAAFAMAVSFRGMQPDECAEFTWAMRDSGEVFDWREAGLDGPVLDKHSTGGVGDLVSLPLGPMLAACGAFVPMVSGRGLGHTGGTLDKLESIPGYDVHPSDRRMRSVLAGAGVVIVGAGARLAPADRRLYAIRDVTATVDCIPLITASILSKKLAAGLQGLVLDVKTGNGAVMPDLDDSRALATSLVGVAAEAGLPTVALITDMSQPLARSAGNALEVLEAIAMLRGEPADPRLMEVTLALGAALLALGGLAADEDAGRAMLEASLASGEAAQRFASMVAGLGGPSDLLERPTAYLPAAPVVVDVAAPRAGWVGTLDTRVLGLAVVALGGGRSHPGASIDPRVGLDRIRPLGATVRAGEPLARVHATDASAAAHAAELVQAAVGIAGQAPVLHDPVIERVDAPAAAV
ncbi:MAG TPA: thymidine phosphorylase [Steroidobacteraceae bacterium]|nr:thymidine phosphorylase [Steroidobacteraceae bacterium]